MMAVFLHGETDRGFQETECDRQQTIRCRQFVHDNVLYHSLLAWEVAAGLRLIWPRSRFYVQVDWIYKHCVSPAA